MGENVPEIDTIADDLKKLKHEMTAVLSHAKGLWDSDKDLDNQHFPCTLYGFVMVVMAKIDFLSRHWCPEDDHQTKRMVTFMRDYLGYAAKPSEIAVVFFRHSLMHTSTLKNIHDNADREYGWLLHYGVGNDLRDQHMTLEGQKLNAGALYFVEDLISAIPRLQKAFNSHPDLRDNWGNVEVKMRSFKKKHDDNR